MWQPIFLRRLEDANFHLLTSLSKRPVRLVAIEIVGPGPKAPCRVFDLNVETISGSADAEAALQSGIYPDDIFFSDNVLTLERDIGDAEDEFRVVFWLAGGNRGRYCDCELAPLDDTAFIKAAIDELEFEGILEWHGLY